MKGNTSRNDDKKGEVLVNDDKKCKKRKYLLLSLIAGAVIESSALVSMAIYWRVQRGSLLAPREHNTCFPQDRFLTTGDVGIEGQCPMGLKIEKRSNTTQCCGALSSVMDGMLTKALADKYNSDTNPEMASLDLTDYKCSVVRRPPPMATLVDIETTRKPVQVGTSYKLFWKEETLSHADTGLRYLEDDGTIYIEETGYFFVFVQLKTKLVEAGHTNYKTDNTYRHHVYLISDGRGSEILEDARSPCETAFGESEATSVMGAVFKLKHGDRIYVATSHPQSIAPDPHSNYISLHSI